MNPAWTLADDGSETVDLEVVTERPETGDLKRERDTSAGSGWLLLSAGGGRHPWFLISGLLMFVGCYLANAAVRDRPDELGPVVALVGVLMLYEWLVLGLGLYLWRRLRGGTTVGEAGQLLGLALLLLADTTLVFNELAIANLALGAGVGWFAATMGVVKLVMITRVVGIRPGVSGWVTAVGGTALTFALPVVARAFGSTGELPAWLATGLWWLIAGLVTLTLWVLSDTRYREQPRRGLSDMMIGLPTASAVMHLLAVHWVYHEALIPAHLSPTLLGLSVVLSIRSPWGSNGLQGLVIACGTVGVWASSGGVTYEVAWGPMALEWSVFRAWLLMAGLAYGCAWWQRRSLLLRVVWPTALGLAMLGAAPRVIVDRVGWFMGEIVNTASALLPKGLLAWGGLVIGLAFAALGIGAWFSGRRQQGD